MILSLVEIATKVFFKVTFTALAKHVVSRIKEKTTPINGRDGSDKTSNK